MIYGQPGEKFISPNYVEREKLTMRMKMHHFTHLASSNSKKIENHGYGIALHFAYYNFVVQHKALKTTPAMAAGLSTHFLTLQDIVNLTDGIQPKLSN